MKQLVLGATLLLASATSFATDYEFFCDQVEMTDKYIGFTYSADRRVITFSDISYFGDAQIVKDKPFGAFVNEEQTTIRFSYHWHYTARYKFVFKRPIHNFSVGDDVVHMELTYDDKDGAYEDNVKIECKRTK